MLRSDTVTMLTTLRGVSIDVLQQDLVYAADLEDARDRSRRVPYDDLTADLGTLARRQHEAADSGRVEKGNSADVDGQPTGSPRQRLFQHPVQCIGGRQVHLALDGNRRFTLVGGDRPLQGF